MIPEAALQAAASELWPGGTKEQHRLRLVRKALEAAAPHMLAGMSNECPTCHGFGRIGDGPFSLGSECYDCRGMGGTP